MASQHGIEQIFDPLGALLSLGGGGGIMGSLPFSHFRDEKAAGTAGGSSIAGTQTRTLNTIATNEIAGASLAANEVTLPAGNYLIYARAPAFTVGRHRLTLRDVTNALDLIQGSSAFANNGTPQGEQEPTESVIWGKITLSASADLRLDHYTSAVQASNGVGVEVSDGTNPEVYAEILIWKTDVGGVLHVRDEKAAATDGGGSAAATWNARTLNTVVKNTIAGASLSSSQITLPAGDYRIQGRAPAVFVDRHKIRVRRDVTGTPATLIVGSSAFTDDAGATNATDSTLDQIVTLAGTDVLDLQHYTEKAKVTNGLGQSTNAGEVEVYAEVFIERLN